MAKAVTAEGDLIVIFLKQSLSLFLSCCLLLTTTPAVFADEVDQSEAPPVHSAAQPLLHGRELHLQISGRPDQRVVQAFATNGADQSFKEWM